VRAARRLRNALHVIEDKDLERPLGESQRSAGQAGDPDEKKKSIPYFNHAGRIKRPSGDVKDGDADEIYS